MTRALVTDGAGFIGSHTVDALLARGFAARVLDLLIPPVHDGTVPAYLPREVEFQRGDVRDPAAMRRALRDVDVVYHFAAYQDDLPDFSTFFSTNAAARAGLYRVGDTRHICSDVSPLEALGWPVQEPLAEMVREYVAWAMAEPGFRNEATAAQDRMRVLGVLRSVRTP